MEDKQIKEYGEEEGEEEIPDFLQPSMYAEMTPAEMAGIKEWLLLQQAQLTQQLESASNATRKLTANFSELK